MKHVKLFEQFLNEAKVTQKDVKKLQKWGYDASLHSGTITVEDGPNHWDDDNTYTYYWDGENVSSETDAPSDAQYSKTCSTVEDFMNAMEDSSDNWE